MLLSSHYFSIIPGVEGYMYEKRAVPIYIIVSYSLAESYRNKRKQKYE